MDKNIKQEIGKALRVFLLPVVFLWVPAFVFNFLSLFTDNFVYEFLLWVFLGLTVIGGFFWINSVRRIESSTLYKISKKRDIPEERKERINVDWHKFRRGNSRWQEFIETRLDYYNFSSPVRGAIDELLYRDFYSSRTDFTLRLDITEDRLKKNQYLYVYFVDYYYDEFERQWEEKMLATVEPEIDEGAIERRRRRLEEHLAEDKVRREADKEYLRDTLRDAVEKRREYVANERAIERLNLPEDEKERLKEELKERYDEIQEEEEEPEEKRDRWSQ